MREGDIMPVTGADVVAKNITKYGGGFINQVNKTMAVVSGIMDEEVTKNISLTDHSLKDLAKLDHPYSLRHPQQLHDPNYLVHTQGGGLLESKQSGSGGASIDDGILKATAFVRLDTDQAQYAAYVVYGTSKMIPRPVLMESRDNVVPEVLEYMKSQLRNLKVDVQ